MIRLFYDVIRFSMPRVEKTVYLCVFGSLPDVPLRSADVFYCLTVSGIHDEQSKNGPCSPNER